jgi:cellulose synthase/poly-beta-1,6-N-acetylglucosamine synthase-like glycosyltransferase
VATGDWLMFLDADSVLSPELLGDILDVIKSKAYVGCGSTLSMPGLPWWASGILRFWTQMSILLHWAAGALFVCRRDAFVEVGGFSQELYALEEIDLSKRIRKWGRQRNLEFTILTTHPLDTSPRKISLYSAREIAGQILRMLLNRRRTLTDKKRLSVWYDGRR